MTWKDDVHTVPNANGSGWVNKVNGRVVSRHRLKRRATDRGRTIARRNQSDHFIHNTDGQIGRANSYGNDPNPPTDKNV